MSLVCHGLMVWDPEKLWWKCPECGKTITLEEMQQ